VGREQHNPVAAKVRQQVAEANPFLGVEPGGGFVHNQHLRAAQQSLGDAEAALHAAGVLLDPFLHLVGQVDTLQYFPDLGSSSPGGNSLHARHQLQVLRRRQLPVEADLLGEVAEHAPYGLRF
jgi:hypothetical protein